MSSANLSRRNSTVTTASSLRNNRTENAFTDTENSDYSQYVPDHSLSKIYLAKQSQKCKYVFLKKGLLGNL